MKPFDLPYNFDSDLISFYKIFFKNDMDMIHSIYFPPFKDDYMGAKHFTPQINYNFKQIHKDMVNVQQTLPTTKAEYFEHIKLIQEHFPGKGALLLQRTNILFDNLKLKQYINLFGITKFCVGSLEQAKIIKEILPNAEITGSITMRVMPEDIIKNLDIYSKYFNNFVLWFPYNRNINLLKQLPPNFKYILLVNCACSVHCDGIGHWLATSQEQELNRCFNCKSKQEKDMRTKINIPPHHLYLFEDYISYYKLQGRESSTPLLISEIGKYTGQIRDFSIMTPNDYFLDINKAD